MTGVWLRNIEYKTTHKIQRLFTPGPFGMVLAPWPDRSLLIPPSALIGLPPKWKDFPPPPAATISGIKSPFGPFWNYNNLVIF